MGACGADLTCSNQDEAAIRVQARPMPPCSRGFVPQRSNRPRKETKEFRLSSQARHELEAQEFRALVIIEDELIHRRASEVIYSFFVCFLGSLLVGQVHCWQNIVGWCQERRPVFINFRKA